MCSNERILCMHKHVCCALSQSSDQLRNESAHMRTYISKNHMIRTCVFYIQYTLIFLFPSLLVVPHVNLSRSRCDQ